MKNKISTPGNPFVVIVILNWNGLHDTIKCVSSLKALDYSNNQILIVDNGSTDDSCYQIEKVFPNVTLLRSKKNLGFGGGCNIGILKALANEADYVWLLNNDTVVEPSALSALVGEMKQDPNVGAVGSIMIDMVNPKKVQAWGGGYINLFTGRSRHCFSSVDPNKLDYLTAASLLLRRDTLLDVGLFDEKKYFMYWEDVDLCFRIKKCGWLFSVASEAQVRHVESASLSKHSALLHYYFSHSNVKFLKRHSPYPFISITLSITSRSIKMLFQCNWSSFLAVIKGAYSGMFS